jgi:2-keto-myo-inositol isomerase
MPPFGLGLNASTLRGTPVLQQIAAASNAGFQALELWFADTDAHVAGGGSLAEIRRALGDAGLSVPTLIYLGDWFDAPESQWPAVKERCARRLAQAAALGAPHTIAAPPAGNANLPLGARRYRELLEIGRHEGSLPSFEFLGFVDSFCTLESALEVLKTADHPLATTVLDPFHIFRGGGSIESIAQLQARQIAVSHFNDAPASPPRTQQRDSDRVWPGLGHLNLRHYLALLEQTAYRGVLSLELFREDLWARDPFEVAQEGMRHLRRLLG